MNTKAVIFGFGLGLVVGVAGAVMFVPSEGLRESSETGTGEVKPSSPDNSKLDATSAENKKLKAENDELIATLSMKVNETEDLNTELTEYRVAEAEREQDRDSRRDEGISRWKGAMENRIKSRVDSLSTMLGMDEEQAGLIQVFMVKRSDLEINMNLMRWRGEHSDEAVNEARAKVKEMNIGEYYEEVLTEEQYVEYEKYQSEQNVAQLESYAADRLSRMVSNVRLTEDQKDGVYEAFYIQAQQSVEPGEIFNSRGYGYSNTGDVEQRVSVMAEVLDDSQLAAYRQQLESRSSSRDWGRGR